MGGEKRDVSFIEVFLVYLVRERVIGCKSILWNLYYLLNFQMFYLHFWDSLEKQKYNFYEYDYILRS